MMTSKELRESSGTDCLASEFNRVSKTGGLETLRQVICPRDVGNGAVPAEGAWPPGSDPQAGVLTVWRSPSCVQRETGRLDVSSRGQEGRPFLESPLERSEGRSHLDSTAPSARLCAAAFGPRPRILRM